VDAREVSGRFTIGVVGVVSLRAECRVPTDHDAKRNRASDASWLFPINASRLATPGDPTDARKLVRRHSEGSVVNRFGTGGPSLVFGFHVASKVIVASTAL
jgi:hypothetical protein